MVDIKQLKILRIVCLLLNVFIIGLVMFGHYDTIDYIALLAMFSISTLTIYGASWRINSFGEHNEN